MTSLDFAVIVLYFVLVAWIGWACSKKSLGSSRSYFLGGGHISWLAIGASLFATNISAEHFIGLAGTGASSGLAVGQFEWLACMILLLLGWLFAPFYLRTGVFTMPEFLEKRYSSACRTYLSTVSLIAYVFTKVSVAVYAGAIVLKTILGWDIWTGAILLLVVTGIYTAVGGLRAVIYTDYFQAGVLILGGFALTFAAFMKAGGLHEVIVRTAPSFFNLWKPMTDPEFPWTGILFGAPILGIWYWCTDQVIVQRVLAAEKLDVARKATVFAGFLKILPVFILVLPGIAGRLLYPNVAPDQMYATMVERLLPAGLKGLVIAGLLAALMSSLSSVFNSSSTLVVMDFYKKRKPHASEKELVRAGQVSTAVLVVVGLLWIPFIGIMSNQLYVYLQSVQAYISPPIAAVFLAGILWKRANARGAFAALASGFVLGALRFVSEIGVKAGWISSGWLVPYAKINFLHFAVLLFFVSTTILLVFGLAGSGGAEGHARIFTNKAAAVVSEKARTVEMLWSLALVAAVLIFWLIFSPAFFR